MKTCADCKTEKPLSEFTILRTGKPFSYCKECNRARGRARWRDPAERQVLLARSRKRQQDPVFREQHNSSRREAYHSDPAVKARAIAHAKRWTAQNQDQVIEGRLRRAYGLTRAAYEGMLEAQKYLCAVCEKPLPPGKGRAVDHCHATQQVRGVLCAKCNLGIGMFGDDPGVLKRAADYLSKYGHDLA